MMDNPLNNPRFSMSVFFTYGSCPYLQTYKSKDGYWVEQGTILTNRNKVQLQNSEIRMIESGTDKIKIQERDPEITYLDSISFVYTDPLTQKEHEVKTNIKNLNSVDNNYYILKQGESLEIDIKKIIPDTAVNIKLQVNGYYHILDDKVMNQIKK